MVPELLQGVKAMQNPDGSCQGWGSGHPAKVPFWMGQLGQELGTGPFCGDSNTSQRWFLVTLKLDDVVMFE